MDRREFAVAGVSAAALLALRAAASAEEVGKTPAAGHAHDEAFDVCAKACSDCQRACDSCAAHCAHRVGDGMKLHMTTLQTCLDCADVCGMSSHLVSRRGPFMHLVCSSCAEACTRCAQECEKFPDDRHMKACAEECRRCEKACREMVKHAPVARVG